MGRASSRPKTDLAKDLNKLVSQEVSKNSSLLQPRAPRLPINAQKGSGREGVASSEGGTSDAIDVTGALESADGLFYIVYEYHHHNG
jgi:hypothetical protein